MLLSRAAMPSVSAALLRHGRSLGVILLLFLVCAAPALATVLPQAERGVLDVLSSDYVPLSLLHAPFVLSDELGISLPKSIAMVTSTPARTVGLDDRGRIAPGLRADLVRVKRDEGVPVARATWREGRRVA